jgi:hypothetical protein
MKQRKKWRNDLTTRIRRYIQKKKRLVRAQAKAKTEAKTWGR